MWRFVAISGLTLALAACATTTGMKPVRPAAPLAPAASRPEPASDARNPQARFVAGAVAMLGQPYRYGGSAPGGFDCSGLVVYAAGGAGIRMPRTAEEQLLAGAPVARSDLKAGDLVFMRLKRKQLHVGIVIDPGRFVHAPATGKRVRIDSLDAPPYARGYMTARRIVGAAPAAPAADVQSHAGPSSRTFVSR